MMSTAVPPHDTLAEQNVLGGLLIGPTPFPEIEALLPLPGAFSHPGHQKIHRAMQVLQLEGCPLGLVTVQEALTRALEAVGELQLHANQISFNGLTREV